MPNDRTSPRRDNQAPAVRAPAGTPAPKTAHRTAGGAVQPAAADRESASRDLKRLRDLLVGPHAGQIETRLAHLENERRALREEVSSLREELQRASAAARQRDYRLRRDVTRLKALLEAETVARRDLGRLLIELGRHLRNEKAPGAPKS